jgi:signal transduction histidine kinase
MILEPRNSNFFSSWLYRSGLTVKLDVLVILILIPTLFMTVAVVTTSERLQNRFNQAGKFRQIIFDVGDLKSGLLSIETGLRGYALTSVADFLEPYKRGLEETTTALNSLEKENILPEQFKALHNEVVSYKTWVKTQLQAEQLNTQDFRRVIWQDSKLRFDRLRLLLDAVSEKARSSFEQARERTLIEVSLLKILPWVLFGVLVLGGLIVRWGLQRFVLRPLKLIEQTTKAQLLDSETSRAVISSQDEIGRLGMSLNASYDAAQQRTQDLKRSNADLEQFAYVATHDLQEPLRMISSYTQLLEKRYKGQLDERADQYIHFAVDGANRMQRLIQDLLSFSRLGTHPLQMTEVDSAQVVLQALNSLRFSIQETDAEVIVGKLPLIMADAGQLEQVFTNLIGNALKFRSDGAAHRVEISATRESELEWRFCVSDNGIGIEPEYFERIFTIFQRLNTREAYAGSGIGLSIVKRIVEYHGGRVWLTSTPNIGTNFYFILQGIKGTS